MSGHYKVVPFDVEPNPPLLKDVDIEHRVWDIRRFEELKEKIGKPQVVVHTSIIRIPAINKMKEQAYGINLIGTQNVCEVVKRHLKILGLILCVSLMKS